MVQPVEMITSNLFRTKLDLLMYWLIDVLIDGLIAESDGAAGGDDHQ